MAAHNLHLVADLGMRVRELTLLHDVTRILQHEDLVSICDWLDEIAQAIRRSWPYFCVSMDIATFGSVRSCERHAIARP